MGYAFFYKSVNGDRVYDDTSFEHWLKKFFTSGVFLNDLQVTENNDMTVTVGKGYTNIDGKVKIFESETPLIIETAGATYPRIDSIVLERNDAERDILLKVIKGGYSSEPVAHVPVRQDGVYQLVIAEVLVNAGAVKIAQADITDTRSNKTLCGIVAGAVDQIDFSQVQAQFDNYFAQYKRQIATDYVEYTADMEEYLDQMYADFTAWFEGVKNQLGEDAAGHLQNQIDDINARLEYAGGSMLEVAVDSDDEEYNVVGLKVNLEIGGKTYTQTIPSTKVVKFTGILETGKARISCVDTAQEIDARANVDIPYYGVYETSLVILSGGSYAEWIRAGGLNPSAYETVDKLLEDEKAIRTLMTKKAAVDVLATLKDDDLATIINNPYVAKWVNYRDYAYSTLSAVGRIKVIMDSSGMYGKYITVNSDGTWQERGLVPTMTSNSAPYGKVIYDSEHSSGSFKAYYAFDGKGDTRWNSAKTADAWLGYMFTVPTRVKRVMIQPFWDSNGAKIKSFIIQGSNDNSAYDDLYTGIAEDSGEEQYFEFENEKYYLYYKVMVTDSYSNNNNSIAISSLQFYGQQFEALIPPMTSNTAPIGEVSASREASGEVNKAFNAFNESDGKAFLGYPYDAEKWIAYKFDKQTNVKHISIQNHKVDGTNACAIKDFILQGSNNGNEWHDVKSFTNTNNNSNAKTYYDVSTNNELYSYYRIYVNTCYDNSYYYIGVIQLYGTPDYESRTYIYEHGVEVAGQSMNKDNGWTIVNSFKDPVYDVDSAMLYNSGTSGAYSGIEANTKLDLTPYKVVRAIVNNKGMIRVYPNKTTAQDASASGTAAYLSEILLDISSINEEKYIVLIAVNGVKMNAYAFWLE